MAAGAAVIDIGTVAVRIAGRAVDSDAIGLDDGVGLLADPHEEHGFDGGEVAGRDRVVAFGDALPVGAVEQVVAHDPAAAFAVGRLGRVPVGVLARGPRRREHGGVVGVLGQPRVPGVFGEAGVPFRAQGAHFVEGGGAGGTGAGG